MDKDNKTENKVEKKVKTNAEKIWEEIKDKPLNMFALPNQKISDYASPANVEPSKAYLEYSVPALLPSLEGALGSVFKIELVGRWIAVSYPDVSQQ